MLNAKGACIVLPFAIAIIALILVGVKEYKRMAAEQDERNGLDPASRDRRCGMSASEVRRANAQVFKSDRTRSEMRKLAERNRGGYQRRYKVEG